MGVLVKICGLTDPEGVQAAVEAGADAVGFVFADSPRQLSPEQARELTRNLPPRMRRVAVMRHPGADEWATVAKIFRPHWLQTEAEDFTLLNLGAPVRRLPVYRDTAELDESALADESMALFESASSGTGEQADWVRARQLAAKTSLILAGGLTPENVASAIRQVRPFGVDISSGVESSRGIKVPEKIMAFVQAVREMEDSCRST